MNPFIAIILFWFVFFLGAYTHESDMARNFKETGDAKALFYEIKCPKGE